MLLFKGRVMNVKHYLLPISIILVSACLAGCERVDQAVDTYKKAKELKSEFEKRSDEVQKDIKDKTEVYKDRIRKKVGLATDGQGKDGSDLQDDRKGGDQSQRSRDDKD